MPQQTTLRNPRKNFGITPETSLLFWAALLVFLFVVPFFTFVLHYVNGFVIPPHEYYWAGIQTMIIFSLGLGVNYGGKTLWRYSLRKRYVKRHLIPFVNKKYNLKIAKIHAANFLISEDININIQGTKVVFMGWELIEEEAHNQTGEALSEKVYLVIEDPHTAKLVELPYEGAEHLASFSPVKQLSLEESEQKTRMRIRDIVDQLPAGIAHIQIVPAANSELPDVVKTIDISITQEGTVQYSNAEMKELVDGIFFNVRMNSQSFIAVSVHSPIMNDSHCVGMFITEEGIIPATAEETKSTFSRPESTMKFLDDISEFKNLGTH